MDRKFFIGMTSWKEQIKKTINAQQPQKTRNVMIEVMADAVSKDFNGLFECPKDATLSRHIVSVLAGLPTRERSVRKVKAMNGNKTDLLQLLDKQRGVLALWRSLLAALRAGALRQHTLCSDRPYHTERKHVLTFDTRLSRYAANKKKQS